MIVSIVNFLFFLLLDYYDRSRQKNKYLQQLQAVNHWQKNSDGDRLTMKNHQ